MLRKVSLALMGLLTAAACSSGATPSTSGAAPASGETAGAGAAVGAPAQASAPKPSSGSAQLPRTTPPGATAAPPEGGTATPQPVGEVSASQRSNLQWKRYAAFENDLAIALGLPKDALCNELGEANCIRDVHLAPLGGHDPFATGLLEPSAEPLATTPTVVDRVVLSACSARLQLERDGAATDAKLFGSLDLGQPAPAPTSDAAREVVSVLYRRLLARDADADEVASVAELAVDEQQQPVSAREFALSACFVVGTSTETLFF